jgi:uncharacterized protein (DUF1778 family)
MHATKTKSPQPRPRFARLEARISPDQKDLFQKAAALEGRTLTDFVVGCVVREAKRIVQENEVIKLSERDRQVFVEALLNPPPPNKALLKAAKCHARQIGDGL